MVWSVDVLLLLLLLYDVVMVQYVDCVVCAKRCYLRDASLIGWVVLPVIQMTDSCVDPTIRMQFES